MSPLTPSETAVIALLRGDPAKPFSLHVTYVAEVWTVVIHDIGKSEIREGQGVSFPEAMGDAEPRSLAGRLRLIEGGLTR